MKKGKLIALWLFCALLALSVAACGGQKESSTTTIALDQTAATIAVGDTTTLTATVTVDGQEKTDAVVSFESSDTAVATVDEYGTVRGVKEGSATVAAKCGSAVATCTITVTRPTYTLTIENDKIIENTLDLFEGETETLTVSASNGRTYAYAWSSSVPSVATVSNGVVSAISEGTTVITATANGIEASVTVRVSPEEVVLLVTPASAEMKVGKSETLTAFMSDGSETGTVNWSSDKPAVATVTNGVVQALAAGDATITASVTTQEGDLFASCEVHVSDNLELIFPEITGNGYFGETLDLQLIAKKNNTEQDVSVVTVTGDGFTYENGVVTFTQTGDVTVTASYGGQPIARTVSVYKKVTDVASLEAIGTSAETLADWYILMNDIDVAGNVKTIAHYTAGHTSKNNGFMGVFDGNGHVIKNYTAVDPSGKPEVANNSLFGTVGEGAVIRNLNIVNARIAGRIAGALATMNYGTIENCFVHAVLDYTDTAASAVNNPIGAVCDKHYGLIKNTVAVMEKTANVTDTKYVGAFVGRAIATGRVENSYSISSLTFVTPTTPTDVNKPGTISTECANYATLADFYRNADTSAFPRELWALDDTHVYPHLGDDLLETDTVTASSPSDFVYVGNSIRIEATSSFTLATGKYGVGFALKEDAVGVSVDANGLLTTDDTATADTTVTVQVFSLFKSGVVQEVAIELRSNAYTVTATTDSYNITWIDGITPNEDLQKTLGIEVLHSGSPITSGYTVESGNTAVVTVADDVATAVGDGTTSITVKIDGITFYTITFTVNKYTPITTVDEFDDISKNLSGKYLLMNDLDFGGKTFKAFGSYASRNTHAFKGIFDGNGYALLNINPGKDRNADSNDYSIFGYMKAGAAIRNLAVIGSTIDHRAGVLAMWVENGATIENCYVEVTITGATMADANNPAGVITEKNYGTVKHCITVVHSSLNNNYVGGVVGRNYSGAVVENCYTVGKFGVHESGAENAGTLSGEAFADLDAFYTGADTSVYGDMWVFANGYYPHLRELQENAPTAITTSGAVRQNTTVTLSVDFKFAFKYVLEASDGFTLDGITLDGDTLTIAKTVAKDTKFKVTAQSLYLPASSVCTEFTVEENGYEATADETTIVKDWVDGTETKVAHGIKVTYGGEPADASDYTIASSNTAIVTVDATHITFVGDGTATVTVKAGDVVLLTISVTSNKYTPITTVAEFDAISDPDNLSGKYVLMNDLDFGGNSFQAFGSWKSKADHAFGGIFDGNGYALLNINPGQDRNSDSDDYSIFGYLKAGAAIRNLAVVGSTINHRAGVLAMWLDPDATIENCYVEATITGATMADAGNPTGGIVLKNYGTVKNCITIIHSSLNSNFIGGIVGRNYSSGVIEKCYTIGRYGLYESATPPTGGAANQGTISGEAFADLGAFYTGADTNAYDKDMWGFAEGYYPRLKNMIEADSFTLTASGALRQKGSVTLSTNAKYSYVLSLGDGTAEGITLDGNTLSASADVPADTQVTVTVSSPYTSATGTLTLTVEANAYEVTGPQEAITKDWIKDYDTDLSVAHNIVVKQNGEVVTEGFTLQSSNEAVVTVDATNITFVGDGTATIRVMIDGSPEEYELRVVSNMYKQVKTVADLTAISSDLTGKYALMNNIDVGGNINTIAHWDAGHKTASAGFLGIFDGRGYGINNFSPAYNNSTSSTNCSLFGTIGSSGIVRNLSLSGVTLRADISGSIATINYGTIENCYASVKVGFNPGSNRAGNPVGGICSKNCGTIRACITQMDLSSVTAYEQFIGGIIGRQPQPNPTDLPAGKVENCYTIGDVPVRASGATADIAGATVTGSAQFADLDAFFATEGGADTTAFDTSLWAFDATAKTIGLVPKENA